ncbi:amidohydrolase family protein [Caulobacter sp. S45]|uniref:amidohydrolase family protein n=1 Tax=Caulobacter sp. S45 TaxID=1641861 RepID=UPI001C2098E8|nr:amidohydrolase family protein [Caulobacter sp. S45]
MIKNAALSLSLILTTPTLALAETANFSVIFGGKNVGHLIADTQGDRTLIDYDFKNNGRGPTMKETIRSNADGLPIAWTITGATTFGSKVDERFSQSGSHAEWVDSTGKGAATIRKPGLYVAQSGSPWSDQIIAHALLKAPGMSLDVLPGGTLRLEKGEALTVQGSGGPVQLTRYDLSGVNLNPGTMLLDAKGALFAEVSPNFIIIRKGYEGEEQRLRKLAADWSTQRFVTMEKQVAHHYGAPVRIRNVRLFDPRTSALTGPMSVVVRGKEIAGVEPLDSPPTPGEVTIDGAGGTLVAGMYDMHAHLQQDGAMLNLIAGITTVRDMGNDNAVLDRLIQRMDDDVIGGPHVVRSGFIEGKSPYSANNGILVDSQDQAIDAVRWYGARGYWQIKIYNSMNPAWVPAMAKEAHLLGMRVAGHVPAFSTADQMIVAGYDEMTHINQFMLGWVMQPGEDTRTLFRLTALKRLPGLDLQSPKVQHTIQLMVDGKKAIDPTLGIHEQLTQNRDGQVPPGAVDYIDHMPIGYRRDAMKAWVDTSAPGDDQAYRQAFDKIIATVRMLHDRGIFIVFGTDTGGSFTYHRELELYQGAGMTPAEIVKRATFDSARYVGQDQRMGSIEKGKLADFFLIPGDPTKDLKAIKTIRMVVKDGAFYYPSEVYPKFGIKPFAAAPDVKEPALHP